MVYIFKTGYLTAHSHSRNTTQLILDHLPQLLIRNLLLRRPSSNKHIIPQQPQPKPSLTIHKIIIPLAPERLHFHLRRPGMRLTIVRLNRALPVAQEIVAPGEEGLAVVRADIEQGGDFESAGAAAVEDVEEDVDCGEVAAGEDVAVDEGWDGRFGVVELRC